MPKFLQIICIWVAYHSIQISPPSDWAVAIRKRGLRDTAPRRLVAACLSALRRSASPLEIHAWLKEQEHPVNLVTVYRVIDTFETMGLVHRQPSTGHIALCSLPEKEGHHLFLSCTRCRTVKEVHDGDLCHAEDAAAHRHGFAPDSHISEILGTCRNCKKSAAPAPA